MREHGSTPTSLRNTLHLLIARGSEPSISVVADQILGETKVFLTLASEHRTSSYDISTAVSLSGTPEAVKDLLQRCLAALGEVAGEEGESR